jgi:hypothetical protein
MPPRSMIQRGGIVFNGPNDRTRTRARETSMATTLRPTSLTPTSTSSEVQRVLELI